MSSFNLSGRAAEAMAASALAFSAPETRAAPRPNPELNDPKACILTP